ncbi:4-hydroxybenzoate octaprenyltransferase [Phanerochaete sordida]|uniref:4-hydroxybenzoate octaprenyltransferase n=1 Tax=Phanerochaete sordida TaxID=48140 RepID=A0A9P3LB16_9APHY|nr:4-hydroxybenzoate octaprenyltransferase [Phanerochaete sordida]
MNALDKPTSHNANRAHALFLLTRLHKFPLGCLILYWPYAWAVAMAASKDVTIGVIAKNAGILLVVAMLFHSAFCVWNDICDRDLDAQVERTRDRPLVTGLISVPLAFTAFIALLAMTFVLVSFTNQLAFWTMLSSVPVNLVYPMTKRWTWWPQFWLGVACSWGCAVGWASIAGNTLKLTQPPAPLLALIAADIMLMIFTDTIYAAQDRADDARAGIMSTARLFGSHIRTIEAVIATGFVSSLVAAGALNGAGIPYFAVGCAGVAFQVAWQLSKWQPNDDESSGRMFKSNHNLGYILMLGILLDRYV